MRRVTTSFRFQLTLKASTGSPHKTVFAFLNPYAVTGAPVVSYS